MQRFYARVYGERIAVPQSRKANRLHSNILVRLHVDSCAPLHVS
jgi:hypothetical protein